MNKKNVLLYQNQQSFYFDQFLIYYKYKKAACYFLFSHK